MDSFLFQYKRVQYIVLVKLYTENERKPQYALLKLEFIRQDNLDSRLLIPVNANGFMTDIVPIGNIRTFFGVEYQENLGVFIEQFYERLAGFIPIEVTENKSDVQRRVMAANLSRYDNENPNKIYCIGIKRNPFVDGVQRHRSIFNDNKTRLLRPDVYQEYADEYIISFCYSENAEDEKTKEEIMRNFAARHYNG
ncbi:MAG: hypothetical protein J1E98_00665 [Lachnospiraceae bacterium]|nr:hypothetical protein [Lachnospiraceae bacterium]